jgi:hypothetical protein
MRDKVYEWQSTGNDAMCDAQSGYHYDVPPTRPHPNCNCTIALVAGPDSTTPINVWHEGHTYQRRGPGEMEFDLVITYGYEVRCPDGSGQSGTVTVTRDYEVIYQQQPDDYQDEFWGEIFGDAMMEARADVEQIAGSLCGPPLIV